MQEKAAEIAKQQNTCMSFPARSHQIETQRATGAEHNLGKNVYYNPNYYPNHVFRVP